MANGKVDAKRLWGLSLARKGSTVYQDYGVQNKDGNPGYCGGTCKEKAMVIPTSGGDKKQKMK